MLNIQVRDCPHCNSSSADQITHYGGEAWGLAPALEPFGAFRPTRLQTTVRGIGVSLPRNYAGHRFGGWLRYLLQTTSHGPVDVTVLGQRMRLHLDNNACERRLMVTPHFFDPEELEILRTVMRPNFHFVDVGANVGTYSLFVGTVAGPSARILAIEPQPQMLTRLRDNIALNEFDIRVAPVAVADHDGVLAFSVDTNNYGFTSLNHDRKGRADRRSVQLPVRTLLNVVRDNGFERIDALKADIEGAEDLALVPFLEQAPRTLWPRLMIVENNARLWRRDLVAFFLERGYGLDEPGSDNLVLRRAGAD